MYLNYIVGGQERVCLLDNETMTAAMKGVMRATGDWVMVQNSNLYYLGRKDRLVKRHGQVLHLDALQQVGASFLMPLTWADDLENISLSTKDSKLPGKSKAFISLSNLLAVFSHLFYLAMPGHGKLASGRRWCGGFAQEQQIGGLCGAQN